MPSGLLSNLNVAFGFGFPRAGRLKQSQPLHLIEALFSGRSPSGAIPGSAVIGVIEYVEALGKGLSKDRAFSSSCYSDGDRALPEVSTDGSLSAEQLSSLAISVEQRSPNHSVLKLLSGACYLPHPAKEETGGGCSFICADEQVIGVAMELVVGQMIFMPSILETAGLSLSEMEGQFLNRLFKHGFNFTYQLERGNRGDLPSSGQVFKISVVPGDVVVAGSDGLFDNLYSKEVAAIVVDALEEGLSPDATAEKIAAFARLRAVDRKHRTPFSTAAQEAGFSYYGGKLDDLTVVVSYVSTSANA
ncbi:putative protein phosphatase 2C 55 [Sesamum angolense]|uniref:Protein phosphatase n=1 Tax=Sesamum angolense TaxID=2727404 RepID=A0AAE1WHW3_9LAMI|nr:putative protein phosphatase 2C 55 [Sesamum angolense]